MPFQIYNWFDIVIKKTRHAIKSIAAQFREISVKIGVRTFVPDTLNMCGYTFTCTCTWVFEKDHYYTIQTLDICGSHRWKYQFKVLSGGRRKQNADRNTCTCTSICNAVKCNWKAFFVHIRLAELRNAISPFFVDDMPSCHSQQSLWDKERVFAVDIQCCGCVASYFQSNICNNNGLFLVNLPAWLSDLLNFCSIFNRISDV